MINQLTPSSFDKVIEQFVSVEKNKMGGSKKKYKQNGGAKEYEKKKLKKLITIKDNIAEALWYLLGGVMVSNYANAYISSIEC